LYRKERVNMNLCAKCGHDFRTAVLFDEHPCMTASLEHPDAPVLRDRRRTSLVTIGPDTVRLCEPECRNDVLLDLGVKGGRGGWVYPPRGSAEVTIASNGKTYVMAWRRCPPSAQHCDLCAWEWHYRVPAVVTGARSSRPLTEGQRAARAAFASRYGSKGRNRENPAA
jgi:hypothetical protein